MSFFSDLDEDELNQLAGSADEDDDEAEEDDELEEEDESDEEDDEEDDISEDEDDEEEDEDEESDAANVRVLSKKAKNGSKLTDAKDIVKDFEFSSDDED